MPTGHNMGDGARRRCTARHGTSSGSLICEIIPFWLIIPLLHRRWLKTTALHRPMAGFSGFAPSLYAKPHFSTTLKSLGPSTATKSPGWPILLDGGNTLLRRRKPLTRSRSSGRKSPTTSADWPLSIDGAERARLDPRPPSRLRTDAPDGSPTFAPSPTQRTAVVRDFVRRTTFMASCTRPHVTEDVYGKLHQPPRNG